MYHITPALAPAQWEANDAAALFDDAAYTKMPILLGSARQSIRMALYLFGGPDADRMIDVLAARQAAGVRVRILLDRSVGAESMTASVLRECRRAFTRLRALGIDVRRSDPRPFPGFPRRKPMAHHKYLVVDEKQALIGGMNIGRLFRRYHDVMIHLTGPTAKALAERFDTDWDFAGAAPPPHPTEEAALPVGEPRGLASDRTAARLLGTGPGQRTTAASLQQNLRQAQASVAVAVCEMGRTDLLGELIACRARGVHVRVLLCPQHIGPLLPPGVLNVGAILTLTQAGVSVHLYRLGPDFVRMHLKMAIFDGERAVVGSTNWTQAGFSWIGETDVEMQGGAVIAQLTTQFETDWQRSAPTPAPSLFARQLHDLYERFAQ